MRAAVVIFPGSNCDRDMMEALRRVTGRPAIPVWHRERTLPDVDLVALPGGFSYGDYLRCGAIAARSPIMSAVVAAARRGVRVLGVCNGFQILTEVGLLPGALLRNRDLLFVSRDVHLRVETTASPFTAGLRKGAVLRIPIAHHDGNYFIDAEGLKRLEDEDRIAFRYAHPDGRVDEAANPNGSVGHIAGVLNAARNVLGMMPHPERVVETAHGGLDGRRIFESLLESLETV